MAAGNHFVGKLVAEHAKTTRKPKVHLVCHSAGSIWMGHLLDVWKKADGIPIDNLIFFAPACTIDFFFDRYTPHFSDNLIKAAQLFQLDDKTERNDNVASFYRKSLLYLVSRSYQQKGRIVPLLGMEKYYDDVQKRLSAMGLAGRLPNFVTTRDTSKTASDSHGGFDNDAATMNSMLEIILGAKPTHPFEERDLKGY